VGLALDEAGAGEPLVLIHGLGTDRGVWNETSDALAERHRVIALDLPGFGESAPAGPGFDLGEVADVVAAEVGGRVGGGFDLLGHSLGGAVALTLARRHPGAVRRLILSAPAGFRPRSRPLATGVATAAPALLRGRRLIGTRLVGSVAARRLLLWGALSDAGRISPDRAQMMLDASRGAQRLRPAAEAALTADLAEDLGAVEVPVGLIWGTRDPLMPPETTETIRRCRPEAPVALVPEAGHVAQLERPELFVEAVDRVLSEMQRAVTTS
jgi:pimeloyl-ACP methyl ester carboxylesterase